MIDPAWAMDNTLFDEDETMIVFGSVYLHENVSRVHRELVLLRNAHTQCTYLF
jgi:hypothetical protein